MAINAPELPSGLFVELGVAAATAIVAGEMVAVNAAGNALAAADTIGLRVVGRAEADVDNSGGSAGDEDVLVKSGVFRWDNSATGIVSDVHVGKLVYVESSSIVSTAPGTNGIVAGIVRRVDADGVWVDTRHNLAGVTAGGAHDSDGRALTAADSGKLFSNLGASGAIEFDLPPATVGLEFHFAVKVAQALRIDPDGTETIELPSTAAQGAAGKYLEADAINESITLRCLVAGTWSVARSAGTWTHQA